jgi:ribosomal protein S18 acetylase RimI-like enzyme
MPPAADPEAIRRILETDRPWAVYALADLAPEYSAHARWHVAAHGRPALLLVYRAFRPPVLFAHGPVADLEPLLAEIAGQPEFYLSVRPEIAALLRRAGYGISREKRMWRMLLDARGFAPPSHNAARLAPADINELECLYADGEAAGEAPPFFDAGMLRLGVYFGIRENGALVAAAGIHVLAPTESVAAIGNVYTRRDQRGHGFGLQVTAAVTAELLRLHVRTVALNVAESNHAAIRVYERLGFRHYCDYREGIAGTLGIPHGL